MKYLAFVIVFLTGCATATTGAKPSPTARGGAECTMAPEVLYGTEVADCKDIDELGFCCIYVRHMEMEQMPVTCGYMLCRAACNAEFELGVATCRVAEAPVEEGSESL